MSKPFRINRLLTLLIACILISLAAAALVFGAMRSVLQTRIEHMVNAEGYRQQREKQAHEQLQQFVDANGLSLRQLPRIRGWEQQQPYVIVSLYVGQRLAYQTGMTDEELAQFPQEAEAIEPLDPAFAVRFSDGLAGAFFYVYDEVKYYSMADIASGVAAFITLVTLLFLFIRRKLRYIERLQDEIKILEGGDLQYPITLRGRDELYSLARGMEQMRLSLLSQQQERDAAHQAGADMVAAMSHDLRTPLTSLLGYMDLLASRRYKNEEEMAHFLGNAQRKAYQIKEMSDKLFDYFYVYSRQEEQVDFEAADADVFLQQILGENSLELRRRGFDVQEDFQPLAGTLGINYSLLQRAFDNIFSNIAKYADPGRPVHISCRPQDGQAQVAFVNQIRANGRARESTKIGLKTCQRAFAHHGGTFSTRQEGPVFHTQITLPLQKNAAAMETQPQ